MNQYSILILDIFEKTSDQTAQEAIRAFAETEKGGERHTGTWKNSLKDEYLGLSPISYIRSDSFSVDKFISRCEWFISESQKDLRNHFK